MLRGSPIRGNAVVMYKAELLGVSIPSLGYPAPPHLPRSLAPTRTCQPQGTKAEPSCPLLQPEDESRGLSGECGPRRLEDHLQSLSTCLPVSSMGPSVAVMSSFKNMALITVLPISKA
ncbi:hypothetical protein TREES_T100017883 [Tupaia chinensis]|uniref:Uncharacterized protein n=1 Tax=Tupaia chinensis TaxID=246437 RepID=L9KEY2_TUPCH|nr:hypothetical protein TREES_T100017883 [Tupaia chinensis]